MPPVRSDASWLAEFRSQYTAWWPEAQPLIAQHQYGPAFKTYPWPTFRDAPWTPLGKPVARSALAVVTTGGLYRPGVDLPFDGDALEGDWGFRALPREVDLSGLAIAHPHFAHEAAEADMNTIFPLRRLGELEAAGLIGRLAPTHYSTMGYVTRAADLAAETAPTIAARMKAEGVEVALVIPV
ncbi:MAG: glycine/sarcosine/betaine reductase selenoprotein B family protein [candidate division NC10 bacterium]